MQFTQMRLSGGGFEVKKYHEWKHEKVNHKGLEIDKKTCRRCGFVSWVK